MNEQLQVMVGRRIRMARKCAGMKQYEVARAIGIPQGTLSHYECGVREIPLRTVLEVARALGVPFTDLIPESA